MWNSKAVLYLLWISTLCESFLSSPVHLKATTRTGTAASALGNTDTFNCSYAISCNSEPAFCEKCRVFLGLGVILFSIASSPVYAEDASFFQQPSKDPLRVKALKELNDLKKLQDSRLELCVGKFRSITYMPLFHPYVFNLILYSVHIIHNIRARTRLGAVLLL